MFSTRKIKLVAFGFAILLGSTSARAADAASCTKCDARVALNNEVQFFSDGASNLRDFYYSKCPACRVFLAGVRAGIERAAEDVDDIHFEGDRRDGLRSRGRVDYRSLDKGK